MNKISNKKLQNLKREDFYLSCALQKNQGQQEMAKFFGVENISCTLILIYTRKKQAELLEIISQFLVGELDKVVALDQNKLLLFKFKDKAVSAYKSVKEFTEHLRQFCYEETGINFSALIGKTVKTIYQAKDSYSFIISAINSGLINFEESFVFLAEEFSFNLLINSLKKEKLISFFPSINGEKINKLKADKELFSTAKAFLSCDLNACQTARQLFIHRNTLTYRLNKIESLTGLNIRKFSQALIFNALSVFISENKND
jgi:carbohydrate diacid regulator